MCLECNFTYAVQISSTPGNRAKLGVTQSNILTAQKKSVRGWERTYNELVSTLLSQLINPLYQPGIGIY